MKTIINYKLRKIFDRYENAYGPPTIVIGMHRSGTSLTTRLLRQGGGYYGCILDHNSEPFVFIRINDLLLEEMKLSWSILPNKFDMQLFRESMAHNKIILQNISLLSEEFFSKFGGKSIEYSGVIGKPAATTLSIRDFLFSPTMQSKHSPNFWGWKDPRNTITLGAWLSVLPRANIIHVIRNGIDVALSLWRRAHKHGDGAPECLDLIHCFKLWEKYTEIGVSWKHVIGNRYIEFKYEELLTSPRKILYSIERQFKLTNMVDNIDLSFLDKNRIAHDSWGEQPELLIAASDSKIFQTYYPNILEHI